MEPKTRKKIDAVLDEATTLAAGGMDEFQAAREALTAQTTDVYRELAIAAIVDTVRRRKRSDVLTIERGAERKKRTMLGEDPGHRRRNTPEYRAWVEATPEGAEYETVISTAENAARARFNDSIFATIEKFKSEMRVEWTQELLASQFSLPDGTRVTWGDATIEQHEERAAMFERNAIANAEGAARHRLAIDNLKERGVPTLGELVSVAA